MVPVQRLRRVLDELRGAAGPDDLRAFLQPAAAGNAARGDARGEGAARHGRCGGRIGRGAALGRNGRRGTPYSRMSPTGGLSRCTICPSSLQIMSGGGGGIAGRGARGVNLSTSTGSTTAAAGGGSPVLRADVRDAPLPVFGANRIDIREALRNLDRSLDGVVTRARLKDLEQHAQKVPEIRVAVLHHLLALLLDEVAAHARGRRVRGIVRLAKIAEEVDPRALVVRAQVDVLERERHLAPDDGLFHGLLGVVDHKPSVIPRRVVSEIVVEHLRDKV